MSGRMIYAWKTPGLHKVSASVAGQEIERIRLAQGDSFAAADLVDAARPDDAPLHPEFEWNDGIAGQAYRIDQARWIMRHLIVVRENLPDVPPVRAFVSVRGWEESSLSRRYTTVYQALETPRLRQSLLKDALRDIEIFERKYASLVELSGLLEEMARVRERIAKHFRDS